MNQFNKTFENIIKPLEEGFFSNSGSWLGQKLGGGIGKVLDTGVTAVKNIGKDIHKAGVQATGLGGILSSDEENKNKPQNLVETIIQKSQPKKTLKISVNGVIYNLNFNGVGIVAKTESNVQADQQTTQAITDFLTKTDFSNLPFSNDYNLLIKTEEETFIKQKQNENV